MKNLLFLLILCTYATHASETTHAPNRDTPTEAELSLQDLKDKFGARAGEEAPKFNIEQGLTWAATHSCYVEAQPVRILEVPVFIASSNNPTSTVCKFAEGNSTLHDLQDEIETKYKTTGYVRLSTSSGLKLIPHKTLASLLTLDEMGQNPRLSVAFVALPLLKDKN